MKDVMVFQNDHCKAEFYPGQGVVGYGKAVITYDKDLFIEECIGFESDIVDELDANNMVIVDMDSYTSFSDGSFNCTCVETGKRVEGVEDYILNIASL